MKPEIKLQNVRSAPRGAAQSVEKLPAMSNQKFWSSFFKSSLSPEAEPLVAHRSERNTLHARSSAGGNP
ncbi:MAG TPA: hypothetical protein DCG49_12330, partial [Ruminococcus sp.]|nr:hypothetical protein [Ruminococcus sp.]